ncbi:conserved exported hypothetical protein [Verrucomicrobia bacterium]|nr:conserved exported hypothetical protein [Verrucomicrobiota bacterium]
MKLSKAFMGMIGAVVFSGSLALFSVVQAAEQGTSGDGQNQKLKPYILKTCVVSGEKLDGMGEPYVYKYKDREIKFCCKDCQKDFDKNPAKYIKKLEEAEKAAKKAPAAK